MAATELNPIQTESEKVERWRAEALEKVGYDAASARMLALRHDVDLHQAIELVQNGCPPGTAVRILS
jgi:hypothetical protein